MSSGRLERLSTGPVMPLVAAVLAIAVAGAFAWHAKFLNDDALITIRYSENLAAGNGLVYNVGERVLGTTTPLWALLLAALGFLGLPLPTTAMVLGVGLFGWTAAASVLLVRERGATATEQALVAVLLATSPVLVKWVGSGMETSAYLAGIATFLWLLERERLVTLGFVGGALVLLRPDAGIFLLVGCVLHCARVKSVRPVLKVLPGFLLMTLPWLIGATLYYGSPLPNSGFAKRLQVADWGTFLGNLGRTVYPTLALAPFALVGAARRCSDLRRATPAVSLVLFAAGMHLGSLPGCPWYMPPAVYLYVLLAAEGAYAAAVALAGGPDILRKPVALAVLVGALLGHHQLPEAVRAAKREQASIERLHGAVGNKLAEIAPDGAVVAVDNIGYIGYRSRLRVVDMMGLVSEGIVEQLAAGDLQYAIRHHQPEFLAIWVGRGATPRYTPDAEWLESKGYRVVFQALIDPDRPDVAYTIYSRLGG
jgi:hypothetical protein